MKIHSISTICRKCLMLLALLLASIQMVHAQEESGGTTTTEQKVYGEGDLIATKYAGGSGTKDDPWLISNDLELAKLAHDVTTGNTKLMFAGKYFKLTQDIDLSKGKWMPIGTWKCNKDNNDRYFAGKFDGDGHTISNMQIEWVNATGSEASWGLFGRLYGTSASSEATYASVTNLIIDNALIQKKKDTAPVGKSVIKIGTVAGDMTQFAEISNTIIRNSKITDNEETYNTPNSFRVGGVVGYIDNSTKLNLFRIFNISADVQVNMLTNATLTSTSGDHQATISGGFGAVSKLEKPNNSNLVILPRNILIHGSLSTSTNAAKCKKGSVMASNSGSMDFINETADDQPITSTWYYTAANKVTGNKDYKYGTEKGIDAIDENTGMTFGKTFVDQINQYISDKKLDRKSWAYLGKSKFAFSNIKLKAERGKQDVLTVVNEDGTTNSEKYDWYVSQDNMKWEKANTDNGACNPFNLPRQTYNQYVYAVSSQSSLRTNTIEVKAIGITAQLDDKTKPGTYIVNVTNDTEEKLSNADLGLTITYEWHNGIDPLDIPNTQNEFTPTNTSHKYKYYCKVIVKSGDNILFKKNVCASVIVYLCPAGVTIGDVKYAVGKDNLTDDEWGYSPEKPMATWQGAYKKLSDKASWDENIIVLMGTSSNEVTKQGFNITLNYQGENLLTAENWVNAQTNHPELFRNATITGKWDKDYKGQIEITGSSKGLPIWGDTRFEHITFNQNGGDSYKIIYCQYNNLEMGDSIKMTGFGVNNLALS
jgi:hypothetical protein